MENYIVKVTIENISGKVIKEETFDTNTLVEVKAFGGDLVNMFITDTLNEIRDERRDNPHHHQNRLD